MAVSAASRPLPSVDPPASGWDRWQSLSSRNFRLYILGQLVSQPGSWLQNVALAWLVLDLTGSPAALGLVTVFQFGPELIGSPPAGVIVDRLDKRMVLVVSVVGQTLQASILAVLAFTHTIQLWQIYALAILFGVTTTFSVPASQALVAQLVGRRHLQHAVGLNAALQNAARVVGPGLGGVVLAIWGPSWCFALNALSFLPLLVALAFIHLLPSQGQRRPVEGHIFAQLMDGVRYSTRTPSLRLTFALLAFLGIFGVNAFNTSLPLLARYGLDSGPEGFGAMNSAMGIGSLIGAVAIATRLRPTNTLVIGYGAAFAVGLQVLSVLPWFGAALLVLALVGGSMVVYNSLVSTVVQLTSSDEYHGRVLALRSWLVMGTSPIGGAMTGGLAQAMGVRPTIALESGVCLAACIGAYVVLRRTRPPEPTWES